MTGTATIDAAPRGNGLELELVYAQHVAVVWRFLRSLGMRDSDVEDVCQEVFVVVHRNLAGFDGRHPLSTWLYAICLRAASTYRRKARFRRELVTDDPPRRRPGSSCQRSRERVVKPK